MAAPVVPIRPETGDLTAAAGRALTTVHRYRGRTCNGTVSYVKAVRRGQNGRGSPAYIPVPVQPGCDLDAGLDRLVEWRWVTVIFVSGSPQ